ncbi:hypothetical protein A3709_20790 [Halioglobus sp. HI00S01]|uniref:hypothetical protein n=1 Tax=Halioglobus sp. HI00S01 TaxID=1822214 RepID=UPI0007C3A33C|nr:hypothetical protein [Halioglobus sp. HI00S01]KZX58052.1 hypothetical protein A3709_20790 [Halioglobus sp. HI00S01]
MNKGVSVQCYNDGDVGVVEYIDHNETHHSVLCQPRDIELVTNVSEGIRRRVIEEIVVSIRIGQGCPEIGVRKNLKWEMK